MLETEYVLALVRVASRDVGGQATEELRRIVSAWFEQQRRRTEIASALVSEG